MKELFCRLEKAFKTAGEFLWCIREGHFSEPHFFKNSHLSFFDDIGFPVGSPFDELDKGLDPLPVSGFFPSCIASAAVSSAALGFEDDFDMTENEDNLDVLPTFPPQPPK